MKTLPTESVVRAEARLHRWMLLCAFVGTTASLVTGHFRFAAALALGAALAVVNYHWLHQAVELLLGEGRTRVPPLVVLKFFVRYPLLFAGVYIFYRTHWLPFLGILAGLGVPAAGVLVEAVAQIRQGLRSGEGWSS